MKDEKAPASTPKQLSVVEDVAKRIRKFYEDSDDGLMTIGRSVNVTIEAPRQNVTVMVIGNHSAGKSSFINWYIGESVQSESVAMETSSFTFISCGKKRETFKGRATIKHKPFLSGIEKFPGAIENLSTQISSANKNLFAMCDFVDTPGLTDGALKYPYPVNEILSWLGERVDLIFVCFDPHGQALCERTMNVVHALNQSQKPKLHYFLTMADKIASEKERSKVILQMAQSLSHSQSRGAEGKDWLGQHALRVRPIFLPGKANAAKGQDLDFNRIDEVLQLIKDAVNQHVQNQLESLESDAVRLQDVVEQRLRRYERRRRVNRSLNTLRTVLLLTAWTIPTVLIFYLLHFVESVFVPAEWLDASGLAPLMNVVHGVSALAGFVDSVDDRYRILSALCLIFLGFIFASNLIEQCLLSVMTSTEASKMRQWKEVLSSVKDVEAPRLWKLYFSDSIYETSDE